MVRYTGRMKVRTGAVNTNQLGLKMSGCPSRVGRNPVNARYIAQRVACNRGICGIPVVHEVIPWRVDMTNSNHFGRKFCQPRSTTCLAAAGGIGNINTPSYRTPAPGEGGCATGLGDNPITLYLYSLEYENLANDTEVDNVTLPVGTKVIVTTQDGKTFPVTAATKPIVTRDAAGKHHTHQTLVARAKAVMQNGLGFLQPITRVAAALSEGASTLEHKTIDTAKKIVTKPGAMIQHLAVDVQNKISNDEHKLKNSLTAVSHKLVQTFTQAATGVEGGAEKEESKLAEKAAEVVHYMHELHTVFNGGKEAVQQIKKEKRRFKEDKTHAESLISGLISKAGSINKNKAQGVKDISKKLGHLLLHHNHHEDRKKHRHHLFKRLIRDI